MDHPLPAHHRPPVASPIVPLSSPESLSSARSSATEPNNRLKRKRPYTSEGGEGHDNRQKVSRACDTCKARRTKCTGTRPCARCQRLALDCTYQASYTRGKPPTPPPIGHFDSSGQRSHAEGLIRGARERTSPTTQSQHPSLTEESLQSRNSPELAGGVAHEGPYLGPASGIAFLNRAWQRLNRALGSGFPENSIEKASKASSVFQFGDKTFPEYSDESLVLPTWREATELVSKYFDFVTPMYRFLHRGTVEKWLTEMYHDVDAERRTGKLPPATAAVILMIFAETTLFNVDIEGKRRDVKDDAYRPSEIFFSAAKLRIASEAGYISLKSVQARLMQCLYLLSSSRENQAWYNFGSTVQLIFAQGMHRKRIYKDFASDGTYIINECRKRTFWSAYTLDRYLSVLLGRPRIFQDEDIDQELPDRINDEDMMPTGIIQGSMQNDCLEEGPIQLSRLARMIGEISKEVYSIRPIPDNTRITATERYIENLRKWRLDLPPILGAVRASSLIGIFRRQNTVLKLAYAHAIIHITRPFLLRTFADLVNRPGSRHQRFGPYIQECVAAAKIVTDTIQGFISEGQMFHAFWFPHYVAFCAVIVLYIYSIQQFHSMASNSDFHISGLEGLENEDYYRHAAICQQHIDEATPRNSFSGRRCIIVLEELRLEVCRQTGRAIDSYASSIYQPQQLPQADQTALDERQYNTVASRVPANTGVMGSFPPPNDNDQGIVGGIPGIQNEFMNVETLRPWIEMSELDTWAYSNSADEAGLGLWQYG